MPRSDHSGMIDGFMSVQAVRRSSDAKPPTHTRPEGDGPPSDGEPPPVSARIPPRTPGGIGHTALPTRHHLICYDCKYTFILTGRLDKVICPKCKTQLEIGDHYIDSAWSGTVKTVGNVYINSGAVVSSAHIIAARIRIAGICRNARLEPTQNIELDTGAQVEIDKLGSRDIVILEDARIELDEPLRCRSLDIHGELQAEARPSGLVTLHASGVFRGTLYAPRMIVHEGAGLKAFIHIASRAGDTGNATDGNGHQ